MIPPVALLAADYALSDVTGQSEHFLLAASIGLPVGLAGQPRLRRVDAEQPDALAVDLDRVAVDYGGAPGQVRSASAD